MRQRNDDAPVAAPARVTIAVLTYRRPTGLDRIIPSLLEHATSVPDHVGVLVIDNDPAASARDRATALGIGRPMRYVHEPKPGIAAARNRAIAECTDQDVLVFIDDDERPTDGWLAALLDTWRAYNCEAVIGQVVSEFESPPERWVAEGKLFDRPRFATGTLVAAAATHNLLLDLTFVRSHRLSFDERFGLTGGSDTLFTRQLIAAGGRIVWCDEALVIDDVPPERATRAWMVRRALRAGQTTVRVAVALESRAWRRVAIRMRHIAQGLTSMIGGGAAVVVGIVTLRLGRRARGMRYVARGFGLVSASVGIEYAEYRRSPGS